MRHIVRPGLSRLVQIEGRNAFTWDERFDWNLKYLENVSFLGGADTIVEDCVESFLSEARIQKSLM